MLPAGLENVSAGKVVRFPNRNVFSGNGICPGGGAGEIHVRSPAAKDLNDLRYKIVTQLFVEKASGVAPIDYEVVGGCIHTGQGNQV